MKHILFAIIFLLIPSQALAAEIFFGTNAEEFGVGQQFEVGVLLNTQGKEVNAAGAKILFPADVLELQAVYEGGSIVNFWVQTPVLEQEGEITFSGVMPGGIAKERAFLFSLVFLAKQTGSVTLQAVEERVLLNDGQGTQAAIQKAPVTLQISEETVGEEFVPFIDTEPPDPFSPQVSKDPDIFDGKWFLVFAAKDQSSGIAGYSVQETRKGEMQEDGPWLLAQSPYLLQDQELKSHIFVKAIDKAGNERIAHLFPQNPIRWYESPLLWGIIVLIGLAFLLMLYFWRKRIKQKNAVLYLALFAVSFAALIGIAAPAKAVTISIGPPSGTFTVGSTFDVSLFLNTEGKPINAIGVSLDFPADKLQVVSPSAGQSIIGVWTATPTFNNQAGKVTLQGGIPGGITTSNGLITTLTFRVKSVGSALVRFLDESKVLLHDGVGTDDLSDTTNGIYELVLPPPAGPIVISETHSEQSQWYANSNVALKWAFQQDVEAFSYVLNQEPVDIPDDIVDGARPSVSYTNVADGIHYFHIKAFRKQSWGGVTNFALKIDTTPPADFPVSIEPSSRTTKKNPIVSFVTTDSLSGMERYELKVVPLSQPRSESGDERLGTESLFIEVQSPYVLNFQELGTHDIIVRAYDQAGNYREVIKRLSIVSSPFQIIRGEGLQISSDFLISWKWFWFFALLILAGLLYGGWRVRKWHQDLDAQRAEKLLPKDITEKLEDLKKYRAKYGSKIAVILLFLFGTALFVAHPVFAQTLELAPPLITTISRNISNEEIFYVGGKTEASLSQVVIYLQNLRTGETFSHNVTSDKLGDWFYRHDTFLSSGSYLLWTQAKVA
ncbi:MAG: cohesin domain-containing protein, partial [bacterium]|nr:cohesin domain-containing protein [bacterium]